jgi:hypothetical protein
LILKKREKKPEITDFFLLVNGIASLCQPLRINSAAPDKAENHQAGTI